MSFTRDRMAALGRASMAIAFGVSFAAAVGSAGAASAQTVIRVGKAVPNAFSFAPLDVGIKQGIFARHGLTIEASAFEGSGRLQQAIASNSIDIGLGAGPEFQGVAKGAPAIGVAESADAPRALVVIALPNGPSKPEDFKGKKIGVSGAGSLTHWLAGEIARKQGWDVDAIQRVGLGAATANIAALKAGQIDGSVVDVAVALQLEAKGEAKIVVRFGDVIGTDFITHVIWASKDYTVKNPKLVTAFLAGWFETIQFMRANKAQTVKISAEVMGVTEEIAAKTYDEAMSMFTVKGTFGIKALDRLNVSFVDMGAIPAKIDLSKYYTEDLLPPSAK